MTERVLNTVQTIGTTSSKVVPLLLNGQRSALTIINTSTGGQNITLSWGGVAIAGAGVVLFAGGSWSESRDPAFDPSTEDVWAVSTAAGGTIAIHERIRTRD